MTEDRLKTCPECEKDALRRKIGTGAGIIFKGSGFYETDYKKKQEPKTGSESKKAKESGDSSSSSKDSAQSKDKGSSGKDSSTKSSKKD